MLNKIDLSNVPTEFHNYLGKSVEVILTGHFYSVPIVPSNVPLWDTVESTVTVNGLKTSDIVIVNRPAYQDEMVIVGARVSANNVLAVTYMNMGAGTEIPTPETLLVLAIRQEKE